VGYSFKVGIGNSEKHPSRKEGTTGDRVFEYTESVYLLMTEKLSRLWLNAAEKFKHPPDQSLVSFENFTGASPNHSASNWAGGKNHILLYIVAK
jgi:hypothetical protein